MEAGESITQCCIREVKEETGISIDIIRLTGVYSDPSHVVAYDDGEVRQAFSMCFLAQVNSGKLTTSSESLALRYVARGELQTMKVHPVTLIRVEDALAGSEKPFVR